MASRPEELLCPLCRQLFLDPVVLTCSHSFCRTCLSSRWRAEPGQNCPSCRRRFSKEEPPINMSLKLRCDGLPLQGAPEGFCPLHSERLELFCLEHRQPVCLVCTSSDLHPGHTFRPLRQPEEEQRQPPQEELDQGQRLQEELEQQRRLQEELEQRRRLQEDVAPPQEELEQRRLPQEELEQRRRLQEDVAPPQEELEQWRLPQEELDQGQRLQEDVAPLKEELEQWRLPQEELDQGQRLQEELEQQQPPQEELEQRQRLQEELDQGQRLQEDVAPLKEELEQRRRLQEELDLAAEHVAVQARDTERQIQEEFRRLRRFLAEEEEARLAALREEEEQKRRSLEERMEALRAEMAELSEAVAAAEDASFVSTETARRRPPLEAPGLPPGALIDQAKHLGNLAFSVWSAVRERLSYSPLVLDPNSAHPELHLSADLSEARRGERRRLPANPERIRYYSSVRSAQGFDGGTHRWEVEVGDSSYWLLGLQADSAHNREDEQAGLWRIGFYGGEYSAQAPAAPPTPLTLQQRLRRVRVELDWSGGALTFSDPDTATPVHTFSHAFTETMFPFVLNVDQAPVRILPGNTEVGGARADGGPCGRSQN